MLNVAYTIGRIFLPVIFIVAGVQKILNVQPLAAMLADRGIPIPDEITPYLSYVGNIPKYDLLGYLIGALEVICGLMIMLGLKARWGALVLVVYAACSIFFVHNFWTMEGAAFSEHQEKALLQLSIIGGLLLLIGGVPNAGSMDRR